VLLALELEEGASEWTEEDGPKERLSVDIAEVLLDKAELLRDYFAIGISMCSVGSSSSGGEGGDEKCVCLTSLPVIIEGFRPRIENLPLFLLRLATSVDFADELECFHTLSTELARFYSEQAPTPDHNDSGNNERAVIPRAPVSADAHVTKNVLFPAFRTKLQPPGKFAGDKTVMQLACLEELYKIFERC
jgi:DNA mismatch repair protein MLH1